MKGTSWWNRAIQLAVQGERCVVIDPVSEQAVVLMSLDEFERLQGKNDGKMGGNVEKPVEIRKDEIEIPLEDAWYIEPLEGQPQ